VTVDTIRETKARILAIGLVLERATRADTIQALEKWLRHDAYCGKDPCLCGLSATLAALRDD
jgi:hypothetical protein